MLETSFENSLVKILHISICVYVSQDSSPQMASAAADLTVQAKPHLQPQPSPQQPHAPTATPWRRARIHRSSSDPVLIELTAKGSVFFM